MRLLGWDSASRLPWGRHVDAVPESLSGEYWEGVRKRLCLCVRSQGLSLGLYVLLVSVPQRMLENRRRSTRSDQISVMPGNNLEMRDCSGSVSFIYLSRGERGLYQLQHAPLGARALWWRWLFHLTEERTACKPGVWKLKIREIQTGNLGADFAE